MRVGENNWHPAFTSQGPRPRTRRPQPEEESCGEYKMYYTYFAR